MLMLLFRVENERWAIAAADIQAIIPRVNLQEMPHSHPMIAGLLNYHGEMLPAVDVSALIANRAAPPLLSTRMVIVECGRLCGGEQNGIQHNPIQRLALVVERAGETGWLSEAVNLPKQSVYAQAALKDSQGGIVQHLAIAPLFKQVFQVSEAS